MDISVILSKKIGVWGYGIGGRALVDFLTKRGACVLVYDKRALTESEKREFEKTGACLCANQEDFLNQSEVIIPSAGIDLRPFSAVAHKCITELDFFSLFFKKPIIAITGTLGKTTVTTVLGALLERAGKRVLVGGNIGIGLCSLIDQQDRVDYAVLEVSSFQLEHCQLFVPVLAIWTNFYANHLDRHASVDEYFAAKARLIKYQTENMISVVPADLLEKIKKHALFEHVWMPVPEKISPAVYACIHHQPGVQANWHTIIHALDALGISRDVLHKQLDPAIEHRIEFVRTCRDVLFYNDSKSTVIEATRAALERFDAQKIILLLGGLSKGVNREPFVRDLAGRVKMVVCFGKEAAQLAAWCAQNSICHKHASDLGEAVKIGYTESVSGDVVLLSPAGSSFDLFKNYQERGQVFKRLVNEL